MSRLLTTGAVSVALLTTSLSGIAAAQERKTLLDFLDIDIIVQRILQSGIMAARTQMDLVYGDFSVDIFQNRASITDFVAWPLPEWDDEGSCVVAIDRVSLQSTPFDEPNRIFGKIQISGASFPTSCLPPDVREPFDIVGLNDISVPRLTLDVDYGIPASDAEMRLHAEIDNVGTLSGSAEFTYIWVDARDEYDPMPVMFLEHAVLSFDNDGLFEAVKPILPPPFASAGAGDMIKGMISEELVRENRRATDTEDMGLIPSQSAFLDSLASSWNAFVETPETIVLETSIDGDVFIDVELIEDDPRYVFETLQPIVSLAPAALSDLISNALITAGQTGDPNMSDADKKSLGLALLTGEGVPRNTDLARNLLMQLENDGEAIAALAAAEVHRDTLQAYNFAMRAGKLGEPGMTALMDRLEEELPLADVLADQERMAGREPDDPTVLDSAARLRTEAVNFYTGKNRPRAYEYAAVLASLAAAAGDSEAADILDDLDRRGRSLSDAERQVWTDMLDRAGDEALNIWVNFDLATKFGK